MQNVLNGLQTMWSFLITNKIITWSAIPVTAIIGVIFYIIRPFFDGYHEDRKEKRLREVKRRQEYAKQLIAFYTEGFGERWRKMPGSSRHIQSVANQIEGDDPEIAGKLRLMLRRWEDIAAVNEKKVRPGKFVIKYMNPREELEYYDDLSKEADSLANDLLKIAHKWQK